MNRFRDMAIQNYLKRLTAAILDLIGPFDPPTRKPTIEPNAKWIDPLQKHDHSRISAYAIFKMPKYAGKYAICGFSQNMRYKTVEGHSRTRCSTYVHQMGREDTLDQDIDGEKWGSWTHGTDYSLMLWLQLRFDCDTTIRSDYDISRAIRREQKNEHVNFSS